MRLFLAALSTFLSLAAPAYSAETPDAKNTKAVLVTGASTGIGRKITERLAADRSTIGRATRMIGTL